MSTPSFKHEPLDHTQPTIRVLKISRLDSQSGLIRCKIKHTAINSKYTCLSYRWGEPNDGGGPFDILVNNKIYRVRQNLYQFLLRAKDRFLGWLWIDAICIDQDNTTERNHQVQHMGEIYSEAKEVLVWLGDSSDVARFLHSASPWWLRLSHYAQGGEYNNMAVFQTTQSYWKRAWVTQEIVLARRVKFMAGAVIAQPEILAKLDLRGAHVTQEIGLLKQLFNLSIKHEFADVTDLTLVQLLEQMQYKQCSFPRDKIYSLLALCKDGRGLVVDYDQTDAAFLFHVLRHFSATSCLCMARLLTECVGPPPDNLEGPRDTHSEKFILEMKLEPGNRQLNQKSVVKFAKGTSHDAKYTARFCRYCHLDLGDYSQKGQYVFCLWALCAKAHGHLYWEPSQSHVLLYQGSYHELVDEKFRPIAPNWGLVYASNTATGEFVLRFTLQGLTDVLHCIWRRSYYFFSVSKIALCRYTEMEVIERTKSRFGGWSILDSSMSEQDVKFDG